MVEHSESYEVRGRGGSTFFYFEDELTRRGFMGRMTKKQAEQAARAFVGSASDLWLKAKGNDMRVFVASLVVLSVLYFWDRGYNNGRLLDGLDSMRQSISRSMFH